MSGASERQGNSSGSLSEDSKNVRRLPRDEVSTLSPQLNDEEQLWEEKRWKGQSQTASVVECN